MTQKAKSFRARRICYTLRTGCHKMKALIKPVLLLLIAALCLFEFVLARQSGMFREFEMALLQTQWMLLVCLAVWCGTFLFLAFNLKDLLLIGLLLIAVIVYFISRAEDRPATDAVTLLFGITLGRGLRVFLSRGSRRESALTARLEIDRSGLTSAATFLIGLVGLLGFASWWHLDMTDNFYHGPRWMGLWTNPNDYGLLMSAGFVVAVGLLAARERKKDGIKKFSLRSLRSFAAIGSVILFIAAGMMGVGLIFSYSRGAWLGTAIGLLDLAKVHGKFKWRSVLPGIFVAAAVAWFFWNGTPDSAPWFMKRMDLGPPLAQHRVAAWKVGFEMIRDHPLGVGWNKAVETYEKNYSPPEGGAAAITTNDYLMLGTQLGLPGLVCFAAYVALCFRNRPQLTKIGNRKSEIGNKMACHAGALAMLVAFWFDGGLFKLATASVFWILLELGRSEMGDF